MRFIFARNTSRAESRACTALVNKLAELVPIEYTELRALASPDPAIPTTTLAR